MAHISNASAMAVVLTRTPGLARDLGNDLEEVLELLMDQGHGDVVKILMDPQTPGTNPAINRAADEAWRNHFRYAH